MSGLHTSGRVLLPSPDCTPLRGAPAANHPRTAPAHTSLLPTEHKHRQQPVALRPGDGCASTARQDATRSMHSPVVRPTALEARPTSPVLELPHRTHAQRSGRLCSSYQPVHVSRPSKPLAPLMRPIDDKPLKRRHEEANVWQSKTAHLLPSPSSETVVKHLTTPYGYDDDRDESVTLRDPPSAKRTLLEAPQGVSLRQERRVLLDWPTDISNSCQQSPKRSETSTSFFPSSTVSMQPQDSWSDAQPTIARHEPKPADRVDEERRVLLDWPTDISNSLQLSPKSSAASTSFFPSSTASMQPQDSWSDAQPTIARREPKPADRMDATPASFKSSTRLLSHQWQHSAASVVYQQQQSEASVVYQQQHSEASVSSPGVHRKSLLPPPQDNGKRVRIEPACVGSTSRAGAKPLMTGTPSQSALRNDQPPLSSRKSLLPSSSSDHRPVLLTAPPQPLIQPLMAQASTSQHQPVTSRSREGHPPSFRRVQPTVQERVQLSSRDRTPSHTLPDNRPIGPRNSRITSSYRLDSLSERSRLKLSRMRSVLKKLERYTNDLLEEESRHLEAESKSVHCTQCAANATTSTHLQGQTSELLVTAPFDAADSAYSGEDTEIEDDESCLTFDESSLLSNPSYMAAMRKLEAAFEDAATGTS